jgi:hypothetical protein
MQKNIGMQRKIFVNNDLQAAHKPVLSRFLGDIDSA